MQAVAVIAHGHQLVILALDVGAAHRWRGAKQIEQQPGVTAEIADQVKIALGLVLVEAGAIATGDLQQAQSLIRY